MQRPSERLRELGLKLPSIATPVGSYLPAACHRDLLMLSGQIPIQDGKVVYAGKVGGPTGLSLEQAQASARLCALNAVAIAANAAGDIDNLARVLKVVVYVACNPGFTDIHKVANGASDLLAEIFGQAGRHSRAAVGVAELPLNSATEVEVTFALASEAGR